MVRLITLHGEISGSARISIDGRGTRVTLALRGERGEGALTAYLIGEERILTVPLSELSGTAAPLDVRGLLLTRDGGARRGEFAAWGVCCGMTAEALTRAKAQVRMMLPDGTEHREAAGHEAERREAQSHEAERREAQSHEAERQEAKGHEAEERRPKPSPAADGAKARGTQGHSPVTEEILGRARELFAGLLPEYPADGRSAGPGKTEAAVHGDGRRKERAGRGPEARADFALGDEEAVPNPFPALFPNSSWRRKLGDGTKLYGVANMRGAKYDITALRSAARYPPRWLTGGVRRVRARDGSYYWLGITRRQPPRQGGRT